MSPVKKDCTRSLYNAFAVLSHLECSGWDNFFFWVYVSYREDQKRLRAKKFYDNQIKHW